MIGPAARRASGAPAARYVSGPLRTAPRRPRRPLRGGAGVSATAAPPAAPEETPAAPPPPDAVAQTLSAPKLTLRAVGGTPLLPLALARAIAFAALAAWGALHWMSLLEPPEPRRAWLALAVGLVAVAAMLGAGQLAGRRRQLAAAGALLPLTALMLMAGRVPDELVLPGGWSELAGGISRGISDLPGVRVPYRGLDDWVRTVIPLGGSARPEPTEGSVRVEGEETAKQGIQLLGQRVGYVFQNPDHQIFSDTVFDEVAFGPKVRGFEEDEIRERVSEALAAVGLEDAGRKTRSG